MICWVCSSPVRDGEATAAATVLPRRLRANEGSRIHLRCHGEWRSVCPAPIKTASDRETPALPLGPRFLYAEDIAKLRGIGVRQARRWLAGLHEEHGDEIIGETRARRGIRRFTTEAALATVTPRSRREEDDVRSVIREILERLATVERQVLETTEAMRRCLSMST